MASARKHLRDSLICPICMGLLTKPKLLPCSHTFCEDCLTEVHSTQAWPDQIPCPVCRSVAPVSYNNVSYFPTNQIAKSLVEVFKGGSDKRRTAYLTNGASSGQRCTVCDADDQELATFYCQHCSEFLCDYCLEQHKRFRKNVFHELVSARDIASGEIRIQLACPEHPRELQQFVCITKSCLVRICSRCLEVGHQPGRHKVIGIEEYEEGHKAAVDSLQEKIEQKTALIQRQSSFVEERIGKVENIIGQRRQEIKNVFEGAVRRIRRRKDQLLEECNTYQRSLCEDLEGIIQCHDDFLENLSANASVVTEECTSRRSDQSLSERVARVGELEALVKRDNPDASLAESIARRAKLLTFHQAAESVGLDLGTVRVKNWELVRFYEGVTCLAARLWQLLCDLFRLLAKFVLFIVILNVLLFCFMNVRSV
ncbi:E3 ubiquitin-protein ligase TRIM56 [Strongylocentrotus purpuratus]|uniref:Uncharacterized protein n=1 Tax=Strongylocentrotus purpuratus TaxID=7668 RepID=A0A7M7GR89_STRPU|nr:E3 ubiquitin-protein ligase TRIM56 [Strongylocentrotus purpuratus]|eukprot:XP_003730176.1 PREDICTED: E3 ubiquitin-protein ligase TRIM56-like [Strongylocentrotus purpuratus]